MESLFRQRLGAGACLPPPGQLPDDLPAGASERLSSNDLQRLKDFMLAGGSIFHRPGLLESKLACASGVGRTLPSMVWLVKRPARALVSCLGLT